MLTHGFRPKVLLFQQNTTSNRRGSYRKTYTRRGWRTRRRGGCRRPRRRATDSAQQGHQRSDWPEANTEEEAFPQGQRALEALQDSCSTPRACLISEHSR